MCHQTTHPTLCQMETKQNTVVSGTETMITFDLSGRWKSYAYEPQRLRMIFLVMCNTCSKRWAGEPIHVPKGTNRYIMPNSETDRFLTGTSTLYLVCLHVDFFTAVCWKSLLLVTTIDFCCSSHQYATTITTSNFKQWDDSLSNLKAWVETRETDPDIQFANT
jgi:hypothetical protein